MGWMNQCSERETEACIRLQDPWVESMDSALTTQIAYKHDDMDSSLASFAGGRLDS
jgi:hypothetical protein